MTTLLRLLLLFSCFMYSLQANAQAEQAREVQNCITEVEELDLTGEELIQKYQQCLDLSTRIFGQEDTLTALVLHKMGVTCFSYFEDIENYQKAIDYWQQALSIRSTKLPATHLDIARSHYNLSVVYQEFFDFETALNHARKSMDIRNGHTDIHLQAQSANQLGEIYQGLKDYDKAVQYFQLSINKWSIDEMTYLEYIGQAYLDLGIVITEKNDPKQLNQAVVAIQTAIQLYNSEPQYYADFLANARSNLGDVLEELGQYESAKKNYQASIRFYRQERLQYELAQALNNLGKIYLKEKKLNKSLALFLESLPLSIELQDHSLAAILCENLGDIYFQLKETEKALNYYQQAIAYEVNGFEALDITQNPTISDNTALINSKLGLLSALQGKANCLQSINQIDALQQALQTYTIADTLLDFIGKDIYTQSSKVHWREIGFQIYDQAITTAYQLYLQTDNANLLDKMFAFSEKNKAVVLLDAVKKSQAEHSGLPADLIRQKQFIVQKINDFERAVFQSKKDSKAYQTNLDSLLIHQEKHQQFINQLEVDFPAYHQLKYKKVASSISKVQEELIDETTAFIEYFIGAENIFTFAITQNTFDVFKIEKDTAFDKQIFTFQQALIQQKDFQVYTKLAYQFYELLLKPISTQLDRQIENLVIAPDGQLGYIPFQTFIKHPVPIAANTEPRYDTLSYLVKDYVISYVYSSALLAQKKVGRVNTTTHDFGAFAPVFETASATELRKLKHSEREVVALNQLLNGKLYLKQQATVSTFKEKAFNFKILHLSTHAAASDNANDTKIHFLDTYLSVKDIYSLPINAQLTVLSACETGVGRLQKGEGIISLERAFMYAGCPSLVTSLWQVDDKKTSDLMIDFYKNLKQGTHKNIALQKAQITYLKNIELSEAAHPFYWSAFILTGTFEPIFQQTSMLFFTILVGMILVTFTIIWYFLKKRKQSSI